MTACEAKTQYRLKEWTERFATRTQSGLSVREWCKSNGVSVRSYYYWLRQVREYAAQSKAVLAVQPEVATEETTVRAHPEQLPAPSGWAAVAEAESPSQNSTLIVEVGGCRIAVNSETDPELLAKVCKVLVSLC
jgi:putative transposase